MPALTALTSIATPTRAYWLTRTVFLRCLGGLFSVAFSVAFLQNKALIGDQVGGLKMEGLTKIIQPGVSKRRSNFLSTWYWWKPIDNWYDIDEYRIDIEINQTSDIQCYFLRIKTFGCDSQHYRRFDNSKKMALPPFLSSLLSACSCKAEQGTVCLPKSIGKFLVRVNYCCTWKWLLAKSELLHACTIVAPHFSPDKVCPKLQVATRLKFPS